MITIRYKGVILNGVDKTGKVETVGDAEGLRLVNMGYAEVISERAVVDIGETRQSAVSSRQSAVGSQQSAVRKRGKKR